MRLPMPTRPLLVPGRPAVSAALMVLGLLAGCGDGSGSRLNPFNWFGRSEVVVTAPGSSVPVDPRPLVASVTGLVVEPYPGGAIVRATGLPPSQGWWEAELVGLPIDENGVQVFEFHVFPPPAPTPSGLPQSREITVAAAISTIRLERVREIVVQGATNSRSSRR